MGQGCRVVWLMFDFSPMCVFKCMYAWVAFGIGTM